MNNKNIFVLDEAGKKELERSLRIVELRDIYVFQSILNYVTIRLRCKSAYVEWHYIDKDYRSEFATIYSKMLQPYHGTSCRIHFFKHELSNQDDIEVRSDSDLGYSGFVCVRPIDAGKIGRTILTTFGMREGIEYPVCSNEYKSHIFGREFKTEGFPFIQQDTMVMCCAQASVWMCARYLSKQYEMVENLPGDISKFASEGIGVSRILPAEGLSSPEVLNVLQKMKLSPINFTIRGGIENQKESTSKAFPPGWQAARSIYTYVESGIPVIAFVPGHAFVVMGHTLLSNIDLSKVKWLIPEVGNVISSAECVDGFLVCDEGKGPYKILPISDSQISEFYKAGQKNFLLRETNGPDGRENIVTLDDVEEMIVPLHQRMYILGEHVELILKSLLEDRQSFIRHVVEAATQGVKVSIEFLASLLDKRGKQNPIVLRPYIIESVKYKQMLRDDPPKGMDEVIKREYLRLPMSKYIWLVEISNAEMYIAPKGQKYIFGEIILDAEASKYGSALVLGIHLPGVIWVRNFGTDGDSLHKIEIPKDTIYSLHER